MSDESNPLPKEADTSPTSLANQLVKKLNPWKELATIAVFFAGTVGWLFTSYATKQYVDDLNCVAELNIEIIRLGIKSQSIDADIVEKTEKLRPLDLLEKQKRLPQEKYRELVLLRHETSLLTNSRIELAKELANLERSLKKRKCPTESIK